ncbi:vesicle-associated membrane protein 4-like isoform X2 [Oratosquilla oratoria]|uniref:vesicle-associated membrane protein 4-like isoform X2 n=1 Tax=Oratosquilla oratoria TaxID=337810 RepID=UPI003F773655
MPPKMKKNLDMEDLEGANDDEVERLIDPDEDDEEDFFLNVQVQIAEVTDVMRSNVGRLLDRGERLDQLQDRSETLASTSDNFRTSATRLRRNMWWQNTRMKMLIGSVILILALIVFIPIILKYSQ